MIFLVLCIFVAVWLTIIDIAKLVVIASGNAEVIPWWNFLLTATSYTVIICHFMNLF